VNNKDPSLDSSAAWIIFAGMRFECIGLISSSNFSFTKYNHLNTDLNPICHLLAFLGAHHILHVSGVRVKVRLRYKCSEYALHSICPCLPLLDLVAILCSTSLNVQKFVCSAHILHLSGFVISDLCLFPHSVLRDWFHNRVEMCLPRGSN